MNTPVADDVVALQLLPDLRSTRCGSKRRPTSEIAEALRERFSPRPTPRTWPRTELPIASVLEFLHAAPFVTDPVRQRHRVEGARDMLEFLEGFPGTTWQERWHASGIESAEGPWEAAAQAWLAARGVASRRTRYLPSGLLALICGDVVRPSYAWFYKRPSGGGWLARGMAATRDQDAFARMAEVCGADPTISGRSQSAALDRVAVIMANKGGTVRDIKVGDCVELADSGSFSGRRHPHVLVYSLLHSIGIFPAGAPTTYRVFMVNGQLTPDELIDRYKIDCKPIRDLLVEYLRERQPRLDYNSLSRLASDLGGLFWKDLELHHPGINSLDLPADIANAWKRRIKTKTKTVTTATGERTTLTEPRVNAVSHLLAIRAFYLDLAQWAVEDPARWAAFAFPCPIKESEVDHRKLKRQRKARMDQRTRERLPALPELVRAVEQWHKEAECLLNAARATKPGDQFTVGDTRWLRLMRGPWASEKIYAEDLATGERRDLGAEEELAFWAWASVEVLRNCGIRVEELCELSHHCFVQYRLPDTGELVPLLQITPSKTDRERLLLISPELADVLSAIICRVRDPATGAVPLVSSYDTHERVWNPPLPLLLQRKVLGEDRPITRGLLTDALQTAIARTGLTGADGQPLDFEPHDFRRIFVTDAIMSGLPPHIAQAICGHADINTTMGYKAVYPEETIVGHRAFLARRRGLRPSEEYRTPTPEEWKQFFGHFKRRKVSLGDCGRGFGTACIHEHACVRCPLLWPDPTQRGRLVEIRDNLLERIEEAEREGWYGEVEGLKVSFEGAEVRLAQMDKLAGRRSKNDIGSVVSVTISPIIPPQRSNRRG